MFRRPIEVAVECDDAVVGRPLTVTAVVRARRDVEVSGVAVGFVGRWMVPPRIALPVTTSVSGGRVDWGLATLVDGHAPVAMAAGEERRWSAPLGPARFPTLTSLGATASQFGHVVEAAASTPRSIRSILASRPVEVRSPRWVNADIAGLVVSGADRVPVRVVRADATPGESVVAVTEPGADGELVREERRLRFRARGRPFRRRRTFTRSTAGPDGTLELLIPAGAAPTMRHADAEVRWFARITAPTGTTEVELNVHHGV